MELRRDEGRKEKRMNKPRCIAVAASVGHNIFAVQSNMALLLLLLRATNQISKC